jgi:ribonucleoside-diphosphate reductase alpha chain
METTVPAGLTVVETGYPIPSEAKPDDLVVQRGLAYRAVFCPDGQDPFDMVDWRTLDVVLNAADGTPVFEQRNIEAPVGWSERAVLIAAQKYFHGRPDTSERETSIRQLVRRIVKTIIRWADEQRYFATAADTERFANDLTYLLLTQRGAFNSPVWFNVGVPDRDPQIAACFIQGVEDDMAAIARLQANETAIFKLGSGAGVNLSQLRSTKEALSCGGWASGPVSFMRGFDAWGGVIKSGGKTRRAAAIRILDADHPDIFEFVDSKLLEERKAQLLMAAGYSGDLDDLQGAYASVAFQNANHSVRVTDEFMELVEEAFTDPDGEHLWDLTARTTGEVLERVPVLKLFRRICEATYACGDPGMQFDTAINSWNTCPTDGRIHGCNPCGEFHWLDDAACNLASLNLMKFRRDDGGFNHDAFCQAAQVFIIAQDVMVEPAHYPTEHIAENSRRYRPLGLGYANLGAYFMSIGVPYDSDTGRRLAAEITSLMTATAYATSAQIAGAKGPYEAFERNRASHLDVIDRHLRYAAQLGLESAGRWNQARALGEEHGYRNAQVTLLAPTGTIGFLMDCQTTGIEPEACLYKEKKLVGGGVLVLENDTVGQALTALRYAPHSQAKILTWLGEHKSLDQCPHIASKHLPVFDCAMAAVPNGRTLDVEAHLKMTGAVQQFLSGAISKTMNLPATTTVEQIGQAFLEAWQLGIKNVTIYRDGCKLNQPLTTGATGTAIAGPTATPRMRKLKDHQNNVHRIRFEFGGIKGYALVTPFEDTAMPGEIFVELAKEGSTVSGLVKGWAIAFSQCLQAGVPLQKLVDSFAYTKFAPAGFCADKDIGYAHSIYDAIVRKMAAIFLQQPVSNGHGTAPHDEPSDAPNLEALVNAKAGIGANPPCPICGAITVHSGANCHKCPTCGYAAGCG